MKKHMILLSILVMSFIAIFPVTSSNAAELEKAKCTMTIEKTHTKDNPATATEPCKDQIWGYYAENNDSYNIYGMRNDTVTKNGQVFTIAVFAENHVEADLTVYTGTQNSDDSETETDLPTLYKLRVTKDNAAVHTSNSGSSKTYKHLKLNDIVEVVEQKGTWYKIKDGSTYGWIWNQYVSTDLTPEVPTVLYKLRVTKDNAAVHTSNSGSSKTYKHLNLNDIVEVVEKKGTWYKIKDGSTYGWIWNQYVSTDLTPEVPATVLYELRVTKEKAAVHTSNSGSSKTYKHLNLNDIVEVVEKKGTWYKIKDGSTYGWIWNQYVSTDLTPEVPATVLYELRVTKEKAAVHTSNSGSSKTYKHLYTNNIVEVVEKKGTWYKIKDGTGYGWIWNKYVSTDLTPQTLYKIRVKKEKAAVHTSNSGKSETYKHLYTNNVVEVVEKKDTWYKIKDGSSYGWIWNQYISTNLTPQTLYDLRIVKDKAAIHTSNSGKSKTYKHLYKNNIVEVVEKKGTWYKIKDGSKYGWVWNQYVSTNLTQNTLYKMKVTKNKAAVHISDSGKSKTYKHLAKNKVVEVVEKKGNWYKIKDGKSFGWIYGNYVKK
ncbi:SH3 domain-containing protein [Niallia taxi]|nr:SH3 domain-containing protein [Niallia taxi]MDE5055355.1 SH3 domain-containing protein [Niallia taxi]